MRPRARARQSRPAALVALLCAVAVMLTACQLENPHHYTVVNDSSDTVVVRVCGDNDCGGGVHYGETIRPGGEWGVNASTRGIVNPLLVTTTEGVRIGCLPLAMPRPTVGVIARSMVVPCQDAYSDVGYWPR